MLKVLNPNADKNLIFSEEKVKESVTKKKMKRKGPTQTPTAGGRRSKRRKSEVSASSPSDSHSDSEEESGEEDYSYHYDGDTCEAYDCTRPVSDKVSWVGRNYVSIASRLGSLRIRLHTVVMQTS